MKHIDTKSVDFKEIKRDFTFFFFVFLVRAI